MTHAPLSFYGLLRYVMLAPRPHKVVTLLRFFPLSTDPQLAHGVLVLVALSAGDEQRLERILYLLLGVVTDHVRVVTDVADVSDDVLLEDLFGLARLLQ